MSLLLNAWMRTKLLPVLIVFVGANLAQAHPGHATNGNLEGTALHYVFEPVHALPNLLALVLIGWALLVLARRRSLRMHTQSS